VCLYLYNHVFIFLFIDIIHLLFEVLCMYVCYLLFPINNNNSIVSVQCIIIMLLYIIIIGYIFVLFLVIRVLNVRWCPSDY